MEDSCLSSWEDACLVSENSLVPKISGIVSSSVSALLLSGCIVLHEPGRVYSQPTYVPVQRTYYYEAPAPRVIYIGPKRHHNDRRNDHHNKHHR